MSAKHVYKITIPEPRELRVDSPAGGTVPVEERFRFCDLIHLALSDRRFNTGRDAFNMANELEELFGKPDADEDLAPGTVVEVPEKHWQLTRDVLDKPQFGPRGDMGYASVVRQVCDWLDDWCDAEKSTRAKPPKEE